MMEEETALITVECLRGRLQAERAASRAAEQDVELLAIKSKELEKQLKIEGKFRRKAEKRLSSLKKKLESLNIPSNNIIAEESERLSSSNASEVSCMSSITSTSFVQNEEHLSSYRGSKSSSIASEKAEDITVSERSLKQIQQEPDGYCYRFEQLALEEKSNEDEVKDNQVDNSMALVPVSPITELDKSSDRSLEVKSEKVREVLDTLKQIRHNLQSSLVKRHIVKVG